MTVENDKNTMRRRPSVSRLVCKPSAFVLADDQAGVRSKRRLLLRATASFEVSAEAGDVDSTRRYVRGDHPDALVLDVSMPGGRGSSLVGNSLDPRRVTGHSDRHASDAAGTCLRPPGLWPGALGYVLREAADEELV